MPTDVMVVLQGTSGLSKDKFVNTLHFDGDQWDGGKTDELWSKYNALGSWLGGIAAGTVHEIRCYAPGLNPTGPYFSKSYAFSTTPAASGPTEVAVCLSYASSETPETSTPRRRGRIYVGPFNSSQLGQPRPSSVLRDAVLDFGEGIAQVGLAANVTWSLLSRRDNSYHKIEVIWCDDSWDTQRRRGLAPTLKEARDVQ